MSKKRRLSPGASSRSSTSTPVPSSIPVFVEPADYSTAQSSPLREDSIAGPSRQPSATPAAGEPSRAGKYGVITLGSGDGKDCGDECYLYDGLPMNKSGYRYMPCAPSPNPSPAPLYPFYRSIPAPPPTPPVHISWLDRSSFLRVSPNAMTATTDRGFRSGRANVSVRQGSWYYEVQILRGNGSLGKGGPVGGDIGNAHVRVGWGRREANMDGPVGMDAYSYAIRDVNGEKVHLSRPKPYGRDFQTGDVVGCLIRLPVRDEDQSKFKRKRVAIKYKGQYYFEMDEYPVQKEMEALVDREGKVAAAAKAAAQAARDGVVDEDKKISKKGATTKNTKKGKKPNAEPEQPAAPAVRQLPTLPESSVSFYLNGEPLGTAFEDLYDFAPLPPLVTHTTPVKKLHPDMPKEKEPLYDDGTLGYYPMLSVFGRGKVRVNFGPDWLNSPSDLNARPITERWDEFREEERILDERDELESGERMRKEIEADEAAKKALAERVAQNRAVNGFKKASVKKEKSRTNTPSRQPTPVVEPAINGTTDVKLESSGLALRADTPEVPSQKDLPHDADHSFTKEELGGVQNSSRLDNPDVMMVDQEDELNQRDESGVAAMTEAPQVHDDMTNGDANGNVDVVKAEPIDDIVHSIE